MPSPERPADSAVPSRQALDDRGATADPHRTARRRAGGTCLAAPCTEVIPCDLAEREPLDALLARLRDVDVLVGQRRVPGTGTLDEFTTDDIDHTLGREPASPILLAKHLAPRMAAQGRGHLVFIASMGAKLPATRLSIYAATKYALRGFAACLRQELHGTGVGVSVVLQAPCATSACGPSPARTPAAGPSPLLPSPTESRSSDRTQPSGGRRRAAVDPARRNLRQSRARRVRSHGPQGRRRQADRRVGRPAYVTRS